MQRIASLWLCSRRLRSELSQTALRYPISTTLLRPSSTSSSNRFKILIDVHVPSARSSFYVSIELTGEELFQGDNEDSGEGECERRVAEVDRVVEALGSEVEIKFGNVECVLFHTLAY